MEIEALRSTLASPARLEPGQKVSRNGVYGIDMATYHGDCCDGMSISSSGVRTVWRQSPAHWFETSPYNAAAWETKVIGGVEVMVRKDDDPDKPHFSLGRAAHHLLFLGRAGFDHEFVVRPSKWKDWRSADAREWREAQRKTRRTIITDHELDQITGMARSLAAHPLVRAGILTGYVERSLIWRCQETGLWLKSRPDNIPSDSGDYADLKTTESVETEALMRTIATYGYHMQGAMVGMASRAVLGVEMRSFTLVFVEKTPPYCVRIVTLKPADLEQGERMVMAALRQVAAAKASGFWPGPGGTHGDTEYLDLPTWARNRADEKLALLDATTPTPGDGTWEDQTWPT